MENLLRMKNVELFCYAPENIGVFDDHYFPYRSDLPLKSIRNYFQWIYQIRRIVKNYDIDLVHILDGDSIRKFFGIGFVAFSVKTVITYHHFFPGKLSALSYKSMLRNGKRIGIVHTQSVKASLEKVGVCNIRIVEYPAFSFENIARLDGGECKRQYGIDLSAPVIGIIGGLARYKRIVPFLQALNRCKLDFKLLICGKLKDITEDELYGSIKQYKDKVVLHLKRLSDEEYNNAIAASDIIYSIYGTEFDGASGPLTDGVCAKKMILASSHGSLGQIVSENHIGITCDCTDEDDVLRATEYAINKVSDFGYDENALNYRESLKPYRFLEKYQQCYIEMKKR